MNATASPATFTVNMSRRINASRERVFRAWTSVEEFKQWWGPEGYTVPEASIDLRVGGAYRVAMKEPGGETHWLRGEFREIISPEKLVYTWLWEGAPAESETLVTVEFRDANNATEVIITHERFATTQDQADHNDGWNGCLVRLAALFV